MFCTKCGQQQVSESVHFCSRCGFKLNSSQDGLAKRLISMAMFLVIAICAIGGWGSFTAGPAYMQIRGIITIVAAIAFYLLFSADLAHILNKLLARNIELDRQNASASEQSALPPAHSVPVPSFESHRVNTAEMLPPPSVTEQTTTLLDKNKH